MSFRGPLRPMLSAVFVFLAAAISGAQDWRTATQLPGVDMSGLDRRGRAIVLQILREEDCPCGCNMKLAQCRIEDQTCPVSPSLVRRVADAARQGHSAMIIRSSLVSQRAPQQLGQQLTLDAVKQAALVSLSHVGFQPPNGDDNTYYYDFGPYDDQWPPRRRIPGYRSPTAYAVELQRTVESIRKDRNPQFWNPHLAQVENVVRQQIDLLNNPRGMSDRQLRQQLHGLSVRGFQILDGAVQRYANSQGWSAQLSPMSGEAPGGAGRVMIDVVPAGATVFYSSEFKFRETAKLGLRAIRDVNANWQRLGQVNGRTTFDIPAAGKSRFYAVWPNGMEDLTLVDVKECLPGNIVVTPVRIQAL